MVMSIARVSHFYTNSFLFLFSKSHLPDTIENHDSPRQVMLPMIRLLYTSTSHVQKNDPAQPLVQILDASTRNNHAANITGLLMHGGGMFMQVLEGADSEVFRLYVRLLDDPRHTDCNVILVTPIEKRMFPGWSMAAMNVPDVEFQQLQEILSHRYETVETKLFSKVMKLFM